MHVTAVAADGRRRAVSVDTEKTARRSRDRSADAATLDVDRIIAFQHAAGNQRVSRALARGAQAAGVSRQPGDLEPLADRRLQRALAETASGRTAAAGRRLIQRVLTGTAATLEPQKPIGQGAERDAWSRIQGTLAKYESLEQSFVAGGERADRAPLTSLLGEIVLLINDYPAGNGAEAERRRKTLTVLVPRLAYHRNRLLLGQPIASSFGALTPAEGQIDSGSMSEIQKVSYGGSQPGFYKTEPLTKEVKDKKSQQMVVPGKVQALDLEDTPNYGARSVALFALDQMLMAVSKAQAKSPLIVNTEFAVLGQTLGIVMGRASGSEAGKELPFELGQLPMFVGCITRLQMLDAIATQLDRHLGNYYIGYDSVGQSAFIWGIDNDLAFTRKAKPDTGEIINVGEYRGMPPVVDEDLARAILALDDRHLPLVLGGVLDAQALFLLRRRLIHMQTLLRDTKHIWIGHGGWTKLPAEAAKPLNESATYWKGFSSSKLQSTIGAIVDQGLSAHRTKVSSAKSLILDAAQKLLVKGLITHAMVAERTTALVEKYANALTEKPDSSLLSLMNADELWKLRG
jgi:hypothetical protein